MHEITNNLVFISDPGHGWLKVPARDILTLGIAEKITPYSFLDEGYAYLEEDCDYSIYMEARTNQGYPKPEIAEQYTRHFDRFKSGFTPENLAAATQ